jgi:hypothetical protein
MEQWPPEEGHGEEDVAMAASFWRLSLTTVSVNMRVSSSVLPSGTSTTYDSRTTQYGLRPGSWKNSVTER